ncbi:MAG: Gfo/Idh/MocA family protein [Spirochaetota bacterium]
MNSGGKIDVFIVGAGSIARHHARALPGESARLAGVVEIDPERRTAFVAEHGGIASFASVEAFLRRKRSPDDLVVVATPPPFHREVVLAVIGAGYHVLCEKPLRLRKSSVLPITSFRPGPMPQSAFATLPEATVWSAR